MGLFDFLKQKPQVNPELAEIMKQMAFAAFPGGEQQIEEETAQLRALLKNRLSSAEAKQLLCKTKALLIISEDKSENRIIESVQITTNGKLTLQECRLVYVFLTGITGPQHSDATGTSEDDAVYINATSTMAGISAEYAWIEQRFGKRDIDWKVVMRSHGTRDDGKSIENFVIETKNGEEHNLYFDISSFYGRF
jgi:hypothetical protein